MRMRMKMVAEVAAERSRKRVPVHALSLFLLLLLRVTNGGAGGQLVCGVPAGSEWRPRPQTVRVAWSLARGVCGSEAECWGGPGASGGEGPRPFPQLCPLQVQLGDRLLFSPLDPALAAYGVRPLAVSEEDFRTCAPRGRSADGTAEAETEPLPAGNRYFSSVHQGGANLCGAGLRLNVTVKGHRCRGAPSEPLCSGRGACRSLPRDPEYRCRCPAPFSGEFCERADPCVPTPCAHGAACVSAGLGYECLCPSHLTGVNCSEVIGNCDKGCLSGRCHQVTPNSFRCICDPGRTGPLCEERAGRCASAPCRNGAACRDGADGYACECPERFTGRHCDVELQRRCASPGCQSEPDCLTEPNDRACVCADGVADARCRDRRGACQSEPCLNNGICLPQGEEYRCKWEQGHGFQGRGVGFGRGAGI